MGGAWDAINGLGAIANMSDAELRKNAKPEYDRDMARYKKELASYESRLKAHEAAMATHKAKMSEYKAAMSTYAQDMEAWNASKNWLGRTKLPRPTEPAAPVAPSKPTKPVEPDSLDKRVRDAKASARQLQDIMRKSMM